MKDEQMIMVALGSLAGATAAGVLLTGAPMMDLATSMSGAAGAAIGGIAGNYLYNNNSTVQKSSIGAALGHYGVAFVGSVAVVGLSSGSWDLVTFGLAAGSSVGMMAARRL